MGNLRQDAEKEKGGREGMIETKNLRKTFTLGRKKIEAVCDTSLRLPDKGFVCVLGESGSGKTTLLNVLSGLETFRQGSIYYGDSILTAYDRKKYEEYRLETFGYIFQSYLLVEDCTVAENVDIALEVSGMSQKDREMRIEEVLRAVHMEKFSDKPVAELSGGEKQRVVVARALAKEPKVIFADEPTANLDRKNAVAIMDLLREVSANCLVLLVTHHTDLAYCYGDRILKISGGKVIGDEENIATGVSQLDGDGAIYLEEYPEECCDINGMDIHMYGDPAEPVRLDIVCVEGKYYLRVSEEAGTTLINGRSDITLLEKRLPVEKLERKVQLSAVTKKEKVKTVKLVNRIANALVSHMDKKKRLVCLILAMDAVLVSLLVAGVFTIGTPDPSKYATSDSHLINVKYERMQEYYDAVEHVWQEVPWDLEDYDLVASGLYLQRCEEFADTIKADVAAIASMEDTQVCLNNKEPFLGGKFYSQGNLLFYGENCEQLQPVTGLLDDFTYRSMEDLDEEKILCGRLGESPKEIVLDKWLADRIFQSDNIVFRAFSKYEDFVGSKVKVEGTDIVWTIVGVARNRQPDVYLHPYTMVEMNEWLECITWSTREYPVTPATLFRDEDVSQADKEAFVEENKLEIVQKSASNLNYGKYQIYTMHPDKVLNRLEEIRKEQMERGLRVVYSYPFREEMEAYKESVRGFLKTAFIVGTVAVGLSLVLLFFLLYSDVQAQKKLLTVYYVNGVRGKYLVAAYFLDLIKLLCITVLPGVLVFKFIVAQFNLLHFIEVEIVFPMLAVGLVVLLFFFYVGLLAAGLVQNFLRKPIARQGIIE